MGSDWGDAEQPDHSLHRTIWCECELQPGAEQELLARPLCQRRKLFIICLICFIWWFIRRIKGEICFLSLSPSVTDGTLLFYSRSVDVIITFLCMCLTSSSVSSPPHHPEWKKILFLCRHRWTDATISTCCPWLNAVTVLLRVHEAWTFGNGRSSDEDTLKHDALCSGNRCRKGVLRRSCCSDGCTLIRKVITEQTWSLMYYFI